MVQKIYKILEIQRALRVMGRKITRISHLYSLLPYYNVLKTAEAYMLLASRHDHPKYHLSYRSFLIQGQ